MSKKTKILRMAAIGATRGVHVVQDWQRWGFVALAAVCDLNQTVARQEADVTRQEGFTRPEVFEDASAMLDWGEFDGVLVATPDATHFTVASEVLQRDVPCLIEKPMTVTLQDAKMLVSQCEKLDAFCMVGHEFRYAAAAQEARRQIQAGRIGTPRLAYTVDSCGRMGSYWRRREWRTSARSPEMSLTLQKALHHLDLQMYLMDSPPESVYASAGQNHYGGDKPSDLHCRDCEEADRCLYELSRMRINGKVAKKAGKDGICVFSNDVHLHDNQVVAINYANGARGSYVECFFTPDYKWEHTIIGDRGRIVVRHVDGQPYVEVETSWIGRTDVEVLTPDVIGAHGGGDHGLGRAFSEALRNGKPVQPTVVDGFWAVSLAKTIDLSAKTGRVEPIPGTR